MPAQLPSSRALARDIAAAQDLGYKIHLRVEGLTVHAVLTGPYGTEPIYGYAIASGRGERLETMHQALQKALRRAQDTT